MIPFIGETKARRTSPVDASFGMKTVMPGFSRPPARPQTPWNTWKSAFLARRQAGGQETIQMPGESQEYKKETPGRQG